MISYHHLMLRSMKAVGKDYFSWPDHFCDDNSPNHLISTFHYCCQILLLSSTFPLNCNISIVFHCKCLSDTFQKGLVTYSILIQLLYIQQCVKQQWFLEHPTKIVLSALCFKICSVHHEIQVFVCKFEVLNFLWN